MPDMTPIVYCLAVFHGYRLLKQGTDSGGWFHRVFAPVSGVILLQSPWIIGAGNKAGHLLLFLITRAWQVDLMRGSASKAPAPRMPYDEKILYIASVTGGIGWVIYAFVDGLSPGA